MDKEPRFQYPKHEAIATGEQEKREIFVEIGAGDRPFPAVLGVQNDFRKKLHDNPNAYYVGLDTDTARIGRAQGLLANIDRIRRFAPDERISLRHGDATNLGFESGSVTEVIAQNILGDIEVPEDTKQAMVEEAVRVLRPEGILRLIEKQSPPKKDEAVSFIVAASNGTLRLLDEGQLSPEERDFDKKVLELQLFPSAYMLRFKKLKSAE